MTALFIAIAGIVVLAAAGATAIPLLGGNTSGPARRIFIAIIGVVPIVTGFIYLEIGAPNALSPTIAPQNYTSAPPLNAEAIAAMPEEDRNAMIQSMVAGLAARLTESGGNIDEWRMLARSYEALDRPGDALAAWREIVDRPDAAIDDHKGFAFASVNARRSEDEPVSADLRESLQKILEADAADPLALYFLGVARAQSDDKDRAVQYWRTLLDDVPPDSPLHDKLQEMIAGAVSD
ncbi:MAG: hypothetical protein HKP25_14135 [Marinicaulis sp.]|nr:hypothetical protein [Marinicaulis sp.]